MKDLYTLIGETRKELNDSILRLETKFDLLEAGRLSRNETAVGELRTAIAEIRATHSEEARNTAVWYSILIGVFFAIVEVAVRFLLK